MEPLNATVFPNSTVHIDKAFEYNMEYRFRYVMSQPYNILAVILCLLAIVLNILVLLALAQVRNRITSHFRLIVSLAVSDVLVSSSVLLYIVNRIVNPSFQVGSGPYTPRLLSRCCFMIIKALNNTGLNITLLNLLLMALDHYIAIMKPLRYPLLVWKTRVVCVIVATWFLSLLLGFSDFLSAITEFSHWSPYGFNYCEVVFITMYQEEYTVFAIAPISLGIMMYSYTRIYWKIRQRRIPGAQESTLASTRRNSKALVTTLLALGSFMVCWLPLCLFQVSLIAQAYTNPDQLRGKEHILKIADRYLYNLLVINSIIDPVIYTVRTREVKIGFRRMFPCKKKLIGMPETISGLENTSLRRRPLSSEKITNCSLLKETDLKDTEI